MNEDKSLRSLLQSQKVRTLPLRPCRSMIGFYPGLENNKSHTVSCQVGNKGNENDTSVCVRGDELDLPFQ